MAYINVDSDIKHYTNQLEEEFSRKIEKLDEQMTEVDNEIMDLNHKVDGLLKLLKTIGD